MASVQAKPFVSGDGLEQMVRAFYPNATVYEHNMLTKTDIEKEIIFYKELLFREICQRDTVLRPERSV